MSKLYNKDSTIMVLRANATDVPITGAVNYASVNSSTKPNVVTWYNLNLKAELGELYNKYKTFNIILKTVSQPRIVYTMGANGDLAASYYLSGLPFKNNHYDYSYGSSRGRQYIGTTLLYPDVTGSGNGTFGNYGSTYPAILTQNTADIPVTFYKADVVDLKITYLNLYGNTPTANIPKPVDFIFQIVGVEPE